MPSGTSPRCASAWSRAGLPEVVLSGGTRGLLVPMTPVAIQTVLSPMLVDVAVEP